MNPYFEEESQYLESLLQLMHEEEYEIKEPENDPPDLVLRLKGEVIGVEHVLWHKKGVRKNGRGEFSFKQPESAIQLLLTKCQELTDDQSIKDLIVRVKPSSYRSFGKRAVARIAKELTESVQNQLLEIGKNRTLIRHLPFDEIEGVYAYRRPGEAKWTTDSRSMWHREVSPNDLQQLYDSKSKKMMRIDLRARKLDRLWLLISIEGKPWSNTPQISEMKISKSDESLIERVFVHFMGDPKFQDDPWYLEVKLIAQV